MIWQVVVVVVLLLGSQHMQPIVVLADEAN